MDIAIHILLVLLMPPLLLGIIAKTKAVFAGRRGPDYLQPYRDMVKLFRKEQVFSATTSWVFRAGAPVTLAAVAAASLLVPLGNHPAPLFFDGDLVLFAYLFGLGRFFTTTAAMDTGSSFEGMGAAREATFACFAEPALFFALATLARLTRSFSLTAILTHPGNDMWGQAAPSLLLLSGGLFVVLLAENCRIPFDDPNTHLELTMIHEVMVLDHSGPGLGMVLYGAAMKLFVLGALFVRIALPVGSNDPLLDWGAFLASMIVLAVAIGVVESIMARLRLLRVPQMLIGACVVTAFSLVLVLR